MDGPEKNHAHVFCVLATGRLRLRRPSLELRLPTPDDLEALAGLAAAGVHDPARWPDSGLDGVSCRPAVACAAAGECNPKVG